MSKKKISSALISVYYKDYLDNIIQKLHQLNVTLYSTGGTHSFIKESGVPVTSIEELTSYPGILGGRVKTLHPQVMGGILARRDHDEDQQHASKYNIPMIDLVIVDLYPFEATVASGAAEQDIIEKIDIGGISLIRAAAKNFKDVLIVSSQEQYSQLELLLEQKEGYTSIEDRKQFAAQAFDITSHYDTAIFNYFNQDDALPRFKESKRKAKILRYGENPHQQGIFYGDIENMFTQLHGKELSYNNLVDIDAAMNLIGEFTDETAFAILKHTNACGVATGKSVEEAYAKAYAADTVSAFGGVLITNRKINLKAAELINELFFEVIIGPEFAEDALTLLKSKKNRVILHQKEGLKNKKQYKSVLNGVLEQDRDLATDSQENFKLVTKRATSEAENKALIFASKICKHTKSNAIVLATDGQLLSSGVGQTSRVDALKQAISKAKSFNLSLQGAVMASDAFFPFADSVEIAKEAGIKAVIQPGGSVRDQDSIDFCNQNDMSMIFTGLRHFKH
ncbi:MAG: bifunctional phosphoribosylaminoimidazolecarboxamide formyltransferase/IMP cyclohydrolase [Cyclobacteriaceae bacterium]